MTRVIRRSPRTCREFDTCHVLVLEHIAVDDDWNAHIGRVNHLLQQRPRGWVCGSLLPCSIA